MKKLSPPTITEDDILRGRAAVRVPLRNGKTAELEIKAMDWRLALAAAERRALSDTIIVAVVSDPVEFNDATGPATLDRDGFLNRVSPRGLSWLTAAAIQLTMGLDKPEKDPSDQSDQSDPKKKPASATTSPPSAT